MPMSDDPKRHAQTLNELRQLPKETEWVEFKQNNRDPAEIGETISALANSAALRGKVNAYMIWGVEDATHDLVGTTFQPTKAKKGNEELENWLLRLLTPKIHFRFREFEVQGKLVSMVEIPRAAHRPVQFQGCEYIRVGSYRKKLKEHPERERELWRIFDQTPFEEQVAAENVKSSDVLQLLDHSAFFTLLKQPIPTQEKGILAALAADEMIAPAGNARWSILNLGAILFARKLAEFRSLRRKVVRVIEYAGNNRIETKREREGILGYAVGFEGLTEYIGALLPSNEVIEKAI